MAKTRNLRGQVDVIIFVLGSGKVPSFTKSLGSIISFFGSKLRRAACNHEFRKFRQTDTILTNRRNVKRAPKFDSSDVDLGRYNSGAWSDNQFIRLEILWIYRLQQRNLTFQWH